MAGRFAGLVALFAASLGILGAGCSSSSFDVCTCHTCHHPYGACPGEDPPVDSGLFLPIDGGAADAMGDR